jgi:hypothetical protein
MSTLSKFLRAGEERAVKVFAKKGAGPAFASQSFPGACPGWRLSVGAPNKKEGCRPSFLFCMRLVWPRRMLCGFQHRPGAQTAGANPDAFYLTVFQRAHQLQIGIKTFFGLVVGMADIVPHLRPFAAFLAYLAHVILSCRQLWINFRNTNILKVCGYVKAKSPWIFRARAWVCPAGARKE